MLPAPSPACGGGSGWGHSANKEQDRTEEKRAAPVSRETLYAVAAEFFRRASRRRYAASIPTAEGGQDCAWSSRAVLPAPSPACGGGPGWGRSANKDGDGTEEKQARPVSRETLYPVAAEFSVVPLAADMPPG